MMMARAAAHELQAEWYGKDVLFTGVSTDSRAIKDGDLFIALNGKNFDGHKFIAEASEKGAVAVMVNKRSDFNRNQHSKIPMIVVDDTLQGLGHLAAFWRRRFDIQLIAVTGSNGKTTVKEMIASILNCLVGNNREMVLATIGNLNNDIGVPKMLLQLNEKHKFAVIEMGMNHSGEISYLTRLAKPTVALITNAGAAHIEGIGSVEAVAHAKGEIFEGLDKSGVAIINADDPFEQLWHKLAGDRKIIKFGLNKKEKVWGSFQLSLTDTKMKLELPDGATKIKLKFQKHNVY